MLGDQESDPGGTDDPSSPSPSNRELNDLKDQYEQQQVLIAQLKEMIRKTEQTTVTEEKLEEYANTLTRMSARAKLSNKHKGTDDDTDDNTTIDTPAKEKILFLRQQMEENKLKLAERKKFQKGIEETVTQLKAQLDDSQHLIYTPLNMSLNETKIENYNTNSSSEELINLLVAKDKRLMDQSLKIQKLEASVLDLQENVKEKDSVIDARTKAITLMSESLSKKGKNTLDALDDTKEQMRKMQENFVLLETEMKKEKQQVVEELDKKCLEVNCLKDEILVLEKNCQDYQAEILELKKDGVNVVELNERIKELEKIIDDLESKSTAVPFKSSPQRGSKKGKKGQKLQKSKSKESVDEVDASAAVEIKTLTEKINQYENTISELNFTIEEFKNKPEPIVTAAVSEFKDGNEEMAKLKKQLDESNKNMIKMKAQNKAKIKELNKIIEGLKCGSQMPTFGSECQADAFTQEKLELKISELSEEVLQKDQEIAALEQQLDATRELSNLKSAQVESEITSIHYEEQVDQLEIEKKQILQENNDLVQEKCDLLEKLEVLSKEKQELMIKLDNYMQENMDLIDKLEKLSAEKVSSAESIEIVESFTQQEKLELEAYQKSLEMDQSGKASNENLAENQELNESVNQLTEETSDLLRKIELFTEERREVMDKMEALALENSQLNSKIHEIENNRDILTETYEQLQNEKEEMENKLAEQSKRVHELEEILGQYKSPSSDEPKEDQQRNLTTENAIAEYKSLIGIQKQEIQELKLQLMSQKDLPALNEELRNEISSLEDQYKSLLEENQRLSCFVKESSEKVYEKDSLDLELRAANDRIKELKEQLINNLDEVENYKSILDENKEELIGSAFKIDKLQTELLEKDKQVTNLNGLVEELQHSIYHLENEKIKEKDQTLELLTDQLQELRSLLSENIQQIEVYESELTQNSNTITVLNEQLDKLNTRLQDMEQDLETKDSEINELIKIRDQREKEIESLQFELKHKEDNFHKICDDLKQKCLLLQSKIEQNSNSLDSMKNPSSKLQELENKNKDQLEKMKKIAANLKRKTLAYQELEVKLKESQEKQELEMSEKAQLRESVKEKEEKIISLLEQLDELEKTYLAAQNTLTQLDDQIRKDRDRLSCLTAENKQLLGSIANYEMQLENFSSMKEMHHSDESNILNVQINEKNVVIENLQQQLESSQYSFEITSSAMNVKIQELEMFIENQEGELEKYKERVSKLEEGLSNIEDRRQLLEQQNFELDVQLREKSNSFEEISHTEDLLEQRIASLMEQDDKIQVALKETNRENKELYEHNQLLTVENNQMKFKLEEIAARSMETANIEQELCALKHENADMHIRLSNEIERYQHLKVEYEKKEVEIEIMEGELQAELERLDNERKTLSVQCEQLREQLTIYGDNRQVLEEEIEMQKRKIEQQQNDYDRKLEDYEQLNKKNKLNQNHMEELINKIANLEGTLANTDQEVITSPVPIKTVDIFGFPGDDNEGKKLVPEEVQQKSEPILANFVWPDSSGNNFFDFVSNQPQQTAVEAPIQQQHNEPTNLKKPYRSVSENDKEELLKKIKTLEFMLYNIEQEKDDVLLQCQSLTNEISRLIYHCQNPAESQISTRNPMEIEETVAAKSAYLSYPVASDQVEPQVVSSQETKLTSLDLEQLHHMEFERTSFGQGPESVCVTDTAYLCHPVPKNPKSDVMETQILSVADTGINREEHKQLHNLEFERTEAISKETKLQHCVEDKIQCKAAYLCYETDEALPGQSGVNIEIFDENDDGWGCGMDEVKLEEDHRQRMDDISLNKNLALHVEELEEKLQVLEVERQRHIEEIKQAQIKSGKLIKKLKEFKVLNDKLNSDLRKSDEFGGLNDAIVDELKSQISKLEKKIKENSNELEKERQEKSNLLKKIETLQTGSERFAELRDKQEVEILSYQRQNRELLQKLEQFEWGSEGFGSPVKKEIVQNVSSIDDENQMKIQELTNTIKELSLDNEELQVMLEEQRNLRISVGKSKSVEPILEKNGKTEIEFLSIMQEKNILTEEKASLNNQLELLTKENEALQSKLEALQSKLESLHADNLSKEKQLLSLKNTLQSSELAFNKQLETGRDEYLQLTENYNICKQKFTALEENYKHEVEQHINNFEQLRGNSEQLRNNFELLKQEKLELETALLEKSSKIESQNNSKDALHEKIRQLEDHSAQIEVFSVKNSELTEKLSLKDTEIENLRRQLEAAVLERSTLTASIEQLSDEWSQRVDERGADVAESWKLHLDMREKEFQTIEQQLRKEIGDLDEKCNAIVNENNELRKNVDAEIRNEVDRISALQQQVFDRDHHINELTLVLQESGTNLELQIEKTLECERKLAESHAKSLEITAEVLSLKAKVTEQEQLIATLRKSMQNFDNVNQLYQESQYTIQNLQVDLKNKQEQILDHLEKLEAANKIHDESKKLLENKDSFIENLQQSLQEVQKQTDSVNDCNISLLNQQINDLNVQLENKTSQFESLNFKFNENLQVKDSEVNKLRNEIDNLTLRLKDMENLKLQNEELLSFNAQLTESVSNKEDDVKQLKNQVNQLEFLLVEKEKEYAQSLTLTSQENEAVLFEKIQEIDVIKRREAQLETNYDELMSAKDADMESLKIQLQSQTSQWKDVVQKLEQQEETILFLKNNLELKNREYEELYGKSLEQNALLGEEHKQLSELRLIIEDQVMKIEELKQELFEKSNDYDSLIAELDIRKSNRVERENVVQQEVQYQQSSSEGGGETVSQAELDLALYMLHQRDVRCEELTVELMQLLEERDTLQLKLSNAIREKEEIRGKMVPHEKGDESSGALSSSSSSNPSFKTPTFPLDSAVVDLAAEARDSLSDLKEGEDLANKLSQLRSVGYGKDKTLLDEQQRRRLQQLSLMQQHRDVAALLPPEAAARLVQDANYTLSRDVQSPSKVLLNWLWGKSTPKVNDI